jgi:hypothetical protein
MALKMVLWMDAEMGNEKVDSLDEKKAVLMVDWLESW